MVVVMPAGHTTQTTNLGGRGAGAAPGRQLFNDDFVKDFVNEIMPYAESHYRIQADRAHPSSRPHYARGRRRHNGRAAANRAAHAGARR